MKKYFFIGFIFILVLIVGCTSEEAIIQSQSDPSQLVGFWKQEKQYTWDIDTGSWKPGLGLENGTFIDTLLQPDYRQLVKGIPSYIPTENCPTNPEEQGVEYYTMVPGGCFKYKGGNRLDFIPMEGSFGSGYTLWKINGNILEMEVSVFDETGTLFDKSKAIFTRTTQEEAELNGWISPESIS